MNSRAAYYLLIAACVWGLGMILYAVYDAYHSGNDSSNDKLLIWFGVPLLGWSLYYLIILRRNADQEED